MRQKYWGPSLFNPNSPHYSSDDFYPTGLLTVEIAEQFWADTSSGNLSQYTSIEDASTAPPSIEVNWERSTESSSHKNCLAILTVSKPSGGLEQPPPVTKQPTARSTVIRTIMSERFTVGVITVTSSSRRIEQTVRRSIQNIKFNLAIQRNRCKDLRLERSNLDSRFGRPHGLL
jgi:hypothetical protein